MISVNLGARVITILFNYRPHRVQLWTIMSYISDGQRIIIVQ